MSETWKFELIEVGRGKYSGPVEVSNLHKLIPAIKAKATLLSNEIEILWDDEHWKEGTIIVGGYRPVGKIRSVNSEMLPPDTKAAAPAPEGEKR